MNRPVPRPSNRQRAITFATASVITVFALVMSRESLRADGIHNSTGLFAAAAFALLGAFYAGVVVIGALLIASRRYAARGDSFVTMGAGGLLPLLVTWWWAWS